MTAQNAPRPAAPPGPRARFPGDVMMRLSRDRLGFFREMMRKNGDISSVRIGSQRVVMLTHPDHIRDVLVTHAAAVHRRAGVGARPSRWLGRGSSPAEGEFHLRQRRLLQPAFHRARDSQGYARQMSDWSGRLRDAWVDGAQVDVNAEMMRLTLNIVAATLFSADVDGETEEIAEALTAAFDAFDFGYGLLTPITDRLPTPKRQRFLKGRARLDATIYRMIRERRASGDGPRRPAVDAPRGDRHRGRWHGDERPAVARRGADALRGRPRDDGQPAHVDVAPARAPSAGGGEAARRGGRGAGRRSAPDRARPRRAPLHAAMCSRSRCASIRPRTSSGGARSMRTRWEATPLRRARSSSSRSTWCIATRAGGRTPSRSSPTAGRCLTSRGPSSPTSRSARGRASASASSSPGWKGRWRWQRWRGVGACGCRAPIRECDPIITLRPRHGMRGVLERR